LEGKASLPEMPAGEDEFVELDEEGNPKKRAAPGARRPPQPQARGGRKPPPRRKVAVTVIPGVAAAGAVEDAEVDEVDVPDVPPGETRPASAPRRRPVGRSTGAPRRS
jgi:small subunit ribosomal protein S2